MCVAVKVKMVRGGGIFAESDDSRVLCKTLSQAASRLTDVLRRAKREGIIRDVARSASKRVVDMIGRMVGACENGCVGEVGANAITWAGAAE